MQATFSTTSKALQETLLYFGEDASVTTPSQLFGRLYDFVQAFEDAA